SVAADPAQNGTNLGAGADKPPPGLANQGYTAEVRWDLTALVNQGVLIPGHNYRFYVMVHDGDQNKTGGDVGHPSYQVNNPAVNVPPPPASLSGFVYGADTSVFLGGVVVTISWTDVAGALQTRQTTSSVVDGSYSFANLPPNTNYTVTEAP